MRNSLHTWTFTYVKLPLSFLRHFLILISIPHLVRSIVPLVDTATPNISRSLNNAKCNLMIGHKSHDFKNDHIIPGHRLLSWVVELHDNYIISNKCEEVISSVSEDVGLYNFGPVGELKGHYLLGYVPLFLRTCDIHNYSVIKLHNIHKRHVSNNTWLARMIEQRLSRNSHVAEFHQEVILSRTKRGITFHDPAFRKQWHLVNRNKYRHGHDINVTGLWEKNVTGKGVTVAVLDDGLQWNNSDIYANYNRHGSTDLNDGDRDPMPSIDKDTNHHGTRCAGEIAGVANSVCGVGVAYGAQVSGIRILAGPMTDSMEAVAFNKYNQINHVFSCSWGPDDDGMTVDGPHHLSVKAMRYGVDFGRRGYGSIYVVASGNGGSRGDNCNYDGYANSIYTITIGAIDEWNDVPYYSEKCASMLAVTYSSGGRNSRQIVTTDWTARSGIGCTQRHSGTSAAAPIAAGLIALMLQAQPCLSWRDVQYLIAITAIQDGHASEWTENKAGLRHSHERGFGRLDAWRLVNGAKVWRSVPFMTSYSTGEIQANSRIPHNGSALVLHVNVDESDLRGSLLTSLEHAQVTVTIKHGHRGTLHISLICPSGTQSDIAMPRTLDNSTAGFTGWTFSTVRCWGENPAGKWLLVTTDHGRTERNGVVVKFSLQLYGTYMNEKEFESRRVAVEAAMSGVYLNRSFIAKCTQPPTNPVPFKEPIAEWTLKLLLLIGTFCFVLAVYETFEYLFCYDKEKKARTESLRDARGAERSLLREPRSLVQEQQPLLNCGDEDVEMTTVCTARTYLNGESISGALESLETDVDSACTDDLSGSSFNYHAASNSNRTTPGGISNSSASSNSDDGHLVRPHLAEGTSRESTSLGVSAVRDIIQSGECAISQYSDRNSVHVTPLAGVRSAVETVHAPHVSMATGVSAKSRPPTDESTLRGLLRDANFGDVPAHVIDTLTLEELRMNFGFTHDKFHDKH